MINKPKQEEVASFESHSVPVVECSKDEGLTWQMWNYWRSTQENQARQSCSRLRCLYPEWEFRVAWTFICESL